MSTERRQVEGQLPTEPEEQEEIHDPLVIKLCESRDQCCDELGDGGCGQCPVNRKCLRLWRSVEKAIDHDLSLREYRCLSQQFYALRLERNRSPAKKGDTIQGVDIISTKQPVKREAKLSHKPA